MKLKFPTQFNITPHSWTIPQEMAEFNKLRESSQVMRDRMLIVKPSASSCGRGIRVISGNTKMSPKEECIVSIYVDQPLLINNKKFDMRVYVLVTSFHPLRAYMYQEGLARFATEEYSNDPRSLRNKFMHLTNFSINKKNEKFVKNEGKAANQNEYTGDDKNQDSDLESSSKWSLRQLRRYLIKTMDLASCKELFDGCRDVIIKTLISAEPDIMKDLNRCGNRQRCCFEIFGFDVMFDSNFKPWVLEVNCLPSLSSSSMFDK